MIEDIALNPSSEYRIIYVTPEWLEKSDKTLKVKSLSQHDMLSLIAIDEAHLFHQWQQFRTAYRLLEMLKIEFPVTPILALTATALMADDIWSRCPDDTNAVERKNRDSKNDHPPSDHQSV